MRQREAEDLALGLDFGRLRVVFNVGRRASEVKADLNNSLLGLRSLILNVLPGSRKHLRAVVSDCEWGSAKVKSR